MTQFSYEPRPPSAFYCFKVQVSEMRQYYVSVKCFLGKTVFALVTRTPFIDINVALLESDVMRQIHHPRTLNRFLVSF